ncbi:virulence protein PGP3-D [Terrimicrobium sacchariphilum]|uniref:Virulence protein PGP3-D n=1 Tax=Terrimicrobium sacchariphilum TaxID=690879 RepID=A0A146GG69_TERSA|nr:virulence factor Pgp3 [Terrimicrobium sacchariphilum]GAT35624.1 virulence protein PGP3-D [Terrimicrobium sacchariphilum]
MSVQSDTSRIQYSGNASTVTPYPVPFYFFDDTDLRVVVTTSGGVDTTLALGTDYAVTGAGVEAGGSLTTTAAIPNTSKVTIFRQVPMTQTTVYEENSDFPAKSHERALDRATMLAQQNSRTVGRSLKVRESDGAKNDLTTVANSVIGFGGDSQPRTFTPAQLAVWLNLTQQVFGQGTKTWLTNSDRASAKPDFLGQVGVQLDNASLWVANGTSAGNWTDPVPGIADGSISTVKLADGVLSADATGRAKMADAFLTLAKIGAGIFTADSTGRGKFASGFVDSSLCASGLWRAIAPAGSLIQTVSASVSASSSFSTAIPLDATIPQNTEGTQVISASITPSSSSSKIKVSWSLQLSRQSGTDPDVIAALFSGAANAIFSTCFELYARQENRTAVYIDSPSTTSPVTYSVRVGASGGTTIYLNSTPSLSTLLGATAVSTLFLEEIKG